MKDKLDNVEVLVLNNSFKINFVEQVKDKKNDLYGDVNYSNFIIRISNNYKISKQKETLLHEILHTLDDTYKMGLKEKQITVLASALMRLFNDNKNLVKSVIE